VKTTSNAIESSNRLFSLTKGSQPSLRKPGRALEAGGTEDATPILTFASYEELTRFAQLGIVYFNEESLSKRPVVWFDELVVDLPFESKDRDNVTAIS
jgi:predicted transcriptional regulator